MLGRVTVFLVFLLLVWGNVVAGMKAGLACPDWPLCHGKVLPPFRVDIYMEFMHRVIAAVTGLCLAAVSYRRYRDYKGGAKAVPVLAVTLLLAEIGMGGAVVLMKTPVQLTTVHFMTGVLIFLLASYMASFDGAWNSPDFSVRGPSSLFFGLGALVFCQAALGAYVRHSEAGLACPDFPACLGHLLPPTLFGPVLVHFSHRVLGYVILLTAAALWAGCSLDARMRQHRALAVSLCVLVLGQIAVGAAVVLTRLNYLATALHLAVALAMLSVLFHLWVREVKAERGRLSLPSR